MPINFLSLSRKNNDSTLYSRHAESSAIFEASVVLGFGGRILRWDLHLAARLNISIGQNNLRHRSCHE